MLRKVLLPLSILLLIGLLIHPAGAVWHILLDEHFNKDQQNPNLTWPWITHRLNNPPRLLGWHHNALNWPTGEARFNFNSWGVQDLIYNSHILQDEEFHQSIWCAYCTSDGPNSPQWPDSNRYWQDANAWAWWGPMDTQGWIAGIVSFWAYMDLDHFARDSLSVILTHDRNLVTSDDTLFVHQVGIGSTISRSTGGDWVYRQFYFDSVRVNGQLTNMLNRPVVWLGFAFQADSVDIAGAGAFIDDVIVGWDDGLFEITPRNQFFGYRVNEDSIQWTRQPPLMNDQVYFRSDWQVDGIGNTPEFTVNCFIDDNLFYTEDRAVLAGTDSVYSSITDRPWGVESGPHVIKWELDAPAQNGGRVGEANENNNITADTLDVDFNPAPQFTLSAYFNWPRLTVEWFITDENVEDSTFALYLYWTKDTIGFPDTLFNY
ncbi:MAG: hypothetical protein V2A61_06985, partial [Calditrichota bacterium]